MPKLIAKERFYYAGRNVEANDEFEAEAQDVALLTDSVSPRAKIQSSEPKKRVPIKTREMKSESQKTEGGEKTSDTIDRGRYHRADMRVED